MRNPGKKLTKSGARRLFTATAKRTHRFNYVDTVPLRGGIRF